MRVTGVVQGVGFRPFVYSAANDLGLTGHVLNDAAGVVIEAQGSAEALDQLAQRVRRGPAMAQVADVVVTPMDVADDDAFRIITSAAAEGVTSIPPDTAVCDDCLAEMRDPGDRRFRHAFIACTNCGPRYTIVTGLPYDRDGTTMIDFPMCDRCRAEYDDPASRRFHAQPTACPQCGPRLSMPPEAIAEALRSGSIVALKGIGGYHLACDAANAAAVDRLRVRKQRGNKPFAVMAADVDIALAIADLDEAIAVLTSPARPIVLAPSRDPALQESIAPGNSYIGVLLPYAPLHHLLFDAGAPRVLVMTSGNVADEPICTTPDEAAERLSGIADLLVHHDRRIHVACDDSVVRSTRTGLQPVRRSRGYAPLPITLPLDSAPVVAVGGELKTTICVATDRQAWLSQHIGDTENLETLAMLARTVATLCDLQRVQPAVIISDLHPSYLSRRWAQEEARRRHVPHVQVQHHHAHLAALLAEHAWPTDQPVLGFAFDGTGYGLDGTIWGGELLVGSYAHVHRAGHLAAIPLPGGDAATRRPLRSALAHAHAARVPLPRSIATIDLAEPHEVEVIGQMLATGAGCTTTTSVGRLFDAIASLMDVRQSVDYEGQAAIELEALAAVCGPGSAKSPLWEVAVERTDEGIVLDPTSAITSAVRAATEGVDRRLAARAFHAGLAESVVRAATLVREDYGIGTVGLTGGVFANAVLTEECQGRLGREGFTVLLHEKVPANDGGLALGQVAVAAAGGVIEQGWTRGA